MTNGFEDEKIEVNKFKKLIKEMYEGFPNYVYYGMVEDVIKNEAILKNLIKHDFLIEGECIDGEGKTRKAYSLGVNALPIVSSWKIETFTIWLIILTAVLAILTYNLLIGVS